MNDVLNRLVSIAEDNSVLLCRLCKLKFSSLHNKQSHFSSRSHTHFLLKELNRVMSAGEKLPRNRDDGGLHSIPPGMECGAGNGMESRDEEAVMEHGTGVTGMESRPIPEQGDGVKCSTAEPTTECASEDIGGDGEGQKVTEGCGMEDGNRTTPKKECADSAISKLDVPNGDGAAPSSDGPVQTEDDTLLVEWTRDYAQLLTQLREQIVARQPPPPVRTGQTSFLNQFQEQERGLLGQIDSLLSLLQSPSPSPSPS